MIGFLGWDSRTLDIPVRVLTQQRAIAVRFVQRRSFRLDSDSWPCDGHECPSCKRAGFAFSKSFATAEGFIAARQSLQRRPLQAVHRATFRSDRAIPGALVPGVLPEHTNAVPAAVRSHCVADRWTESVIL